MSLKCLRCQAPFEPTDPPTGYCGLCAGHFREERQAARLRQQGKNFFADGTAAKLSDCPATIKVSVGDKADGPRCGVCGSDSLHPEYGFCIFGLGNFVECRVCDAILDFVADNGE